MWSETGVTLVLYGEVAEGCVVWVVLLTDVKVGLGGISSLVINWDFCPSEIGSFSTEALSVMYTNVSFPNGNRSLNLYFCYTPF